MAVTCLNENKKSKFIIFIVIASLFHLSSLVGLVLLLLYNIRVNQKIVNIYLLGGILCAFLSPYIFDFVSKYTPYGVYLLSNSGYGAFDTKSLLNLLVRIVMLIFVLIFYKKIKTEEPLNIFHHMILVCTFFQILSVMNNAIARVTTIFFTGYLIIIPEIVSNTNFFKKNRILLYPTIILAMFIYHYVYYIFIVAEQKGAYNSIWSE